MITVLRVLSLIVCGVMLIAIGRDSGKEYVKSRIETLCNTENVLVLNDAAYVCVPCEGCKDNKDKKEK